MRLRVEGYGSVTLTKCKGNVFINGDENSDSGILGELVDMPVEGYHFVHYGVDYMVHKDYTKPRYWTTTHLDTGFAVHPFLKSTRIESVRTAIVMLDRYREEEITDWYFERARKIRHRRGMEPKAEWTLV